MDGAVEDDDGAAAQAGDPVRDDVAGVQGNEKRTQLGLYLSMERRGHR